MSFSQADLTAIDAALATGATEVRYADGRQVRYRTLADLLALRRRVAAEVGVTLDRGPRAIILEHRR